MGGRSRLLLVLVALALGAAYEQTWDAPLKLAGAKLKRYARQLPNGQYPFYTGPDGKYVNKPLHTWTSGFFTGSLWMYHELTGDPEAAQLATTMLPAMRAASSFTYTHDIGFMILCSFGHAARLAPHLAADSLAVITTAAASLSSRFNPAVGAYRAWDKNFDRFGPDNFNIIIDSVMNAELLLASGNRVWFEQGAQHLRTCMRELLRPDGSSYHVAVLDPHSGRTLGRITHQGAADESTWARGQAWAIHGFAMGHRYTEGPEMLAASVAAADWMVQRLPADGIPPWDFSVADPDDLAAKDSSAAAIAAAGLLELCGLPGLSRFCGTASRMLQSLSSAVYLDGLSGPESMDALLRHGTGHHPKGITDGGLVYSDYFYLQALTRARRLAQ